MSELTVLPPQQIVDVNKTALTIEQIVSQRDLIKQCMAKAMEEGQHYGKIPGCGDKPTLLQPGAQLLSHLFRLRPEYEIFETDLPNDHKRFRVTCRLFVMGSTPPIPISEGVGESSSMESKHRFRNAAKEIKWTTDPVPGVYWKLHNEDKKDGGSRAREWLQKSYEGANMGTKKDPSGQYVFVEYLGGSEDKVENSNPADVFNTVLKIAKKRAYVDATITATASSDFFTQDLEDIAANVEAIRNEKPADATTAKTTAPATAGQTDRSNQSAGSWTQVICTFGKKKGPLLGKKLGDLNDDSLEYLAKIFLVEGKEIAEKDRKMVAALAMWKGSRKPAPQSDGGLSEDQIQFNGDAHETLYKQLVWDEIKPSDFIAAMKSVKILPDNAKEFRMMSDATAKVLMDDWENAKAVTLKFVASTSKAARKDSEK